MASKQTERTCVDIWLETQFEESATLCFYAMAMIYPTHIKKNLFLA